MTFRSTTVSEKIREAEKDHFVTGDVKGKMLVVEYEGSKVDTFIKEVDEALQLFDKESRKVGNDYIAAQNLARSMYSNVLRADKVFRPFQITAWKLALVAVAPGIGVVTNRDLASSCMNPVWAMIDIDTPPEILPFLENTQVLIGDLFSSYGKSGEAGSTIHYKFDAMPRVFNEECKTRIHQAVERDVELYYGIQELKPPLDKSKELALTVSDSFVATLFLEDGTPGKPPVPDIVKKFITEAITDLKKYLPPENTSVLIQAINLWKCVFKETAEHLILERYSTIANIGAISYDKHFKDKVLKDVTPEPIWQELNRALVDLATFCEKLQMK